MRVNMPSGHSVDLVDYHSLTTRQVKRIYAAVDGDASQGEQALALVDAVISLLVEAWSYEQPVPAENADCADNIPWGDYQALLKAIEPALGFIKGDDDGPDGADDPKADTGASSESKRGSRGSAYRKTPR